MYKELNDEAKEYILEELNKKKYNKKIIERCKNEINILYDKGDLFILEYLHIYKQDNKNVNYHFRGMDNNYLLLYILGLSKVNPIKYNLSYELCNGLSRSIDFINGSYLDFLNVLEIIGNNFKLVKVLNDEFNHYMLIPHNYKCNLTFKLNNNKFEILEDYINIKKEYIGFVFNDKYIEESILNNDFEKKLENLLLPKKIEDYVKIKSLGHGTDVWNYNQEKLFKKGIININNIISNRDDMYEYLIKHDIDKDLSIKITNFIGKGKNIRKNKEWLEYKEILKKYNCEEWFIEVCSKIKFLFGRGQALSECLYVLKKGK